MARKDYELIRTYFEDYIRTWKTKDKGVIDRLIDPYILFFTSTSLKMATGAQHSRYGVYDFLDDFPAVDVLQLRIYNYVCRIHGDTAYGYAEVTCSGHKQAETLQSIDFTVFVQTTWTKTDDWRITAMRHEAVYEKGDLLSEFEKKWHFEQQPGGRVQMVRGEADSPWLNIAEDESELNETEKIKDCIIKNVYGQEHIVFTHCYETYSRDFNAYTYWPGKESRMKDVIQQAKAARLLVRYDQQPLKFRHIEIQGDRAFVDVDRVRGRQTNTGSNHSTDGNISLAERTRQAALYEIYYPYTEENMSIEHTVARGHYEMVREDGNWKIAYRSLYSGIYECDAYDDNCLYGDEC